MTKATQYFLATNSANGFYSVYEDLIESPDEKIYIIKSGPGSGKSTLMKTAAESIAKGARLPSIYTAPATPTALTP